MGYRKSSAAVDANALQAMRDVTHQMGLREAQEHPELVNLYAIGELGGASTPHRPLSSSCAATCSGPHADIAR